GPGRELNANLRESGVEGSDEITAPIAATTSPIVARRGVARPAVKAAADPHFYEDLLVQRDFAVVERGEVYLKSRVAALHIVDRKHQASRKLAPLLLGVAVEPSCTS